MLYLREINKFLALVCILREYNFSRQGVIDYNFLCFRDAIHKVFEIRATKQEALAESSYDDEYGDGEDEDDDDELEDQDDRNDVRRSLRLHRYTSDEEEEHNYPRPSIVING